MTSSQRVAVVTGSSSGNGYETSLTLARTGLDSIFISKKLSTGFYNSLWRDNGKILRKERHINFQSMVKTLK
jgi:short-subunit dehydrogenase